MDDEDSENEEDSDEEDSNEEEEEDDQVDDSLNDESGADQESLDHDEDSNEVGLGPIANNDDSVPEEGSSYLDNIQHAMQFPGVHAHPPGSGHHHPH